MLKKLTPLYKRKSVAIIEINGTIPMNTNKMLVHNLLEESARTLPDQIAVVHDDKKSDYCSLNRLSNELTANLLNLGVKKGDRVALLLENSVEYIITYYSVLKCGGVAVPLSTDIKPDALIQILLEFEPALLVASAKFERLIKSITSKITIRNCVLVNPKLSWADASLKIHAWENLVTEGETQNPTVEIHENDICSIIYTSGSMGKPKGVVLTHRNIVINTLDICEYLQLTSDDIQMVVLPFFYVMGKSLLNTHVAVGGKIVINNSFAFPASVVKQMVSEKVTGFSGVPSTYAYLMHRSPLADYRDKLESLRYCSQAGGHMPELNKIKLREILPSHVKIFIMYGATEASARLTYLDPEYFTDKMTSIGKPLKNVIINILDDNGGRIPEGEIGEIVAQGPNIMKGYWNDLPATEKVLDDNGYHTGDLGYKDQDGFIYVTGRKDNQLKVGGHRINTQEIEDVLIKSNLLIEASVIGVPDDLQGNRLIAVVVPDNDQCTEEQLLKICYDHLPKFKIPSSIKFVRYLPKTSNSKVDKNKVLDLATK